MLKQILSEYKYLWGEQFGIPILTQKDEPASRANPLKNGALR